MPDPKPDPQPDLEQLLAPGTPAFDLWRRCVDGDEEARAEVRRGLFLAALASGRDVIYIENLAASATALSCGVPLEQYAGEVVDAAANVGWRIDASWDHGRVLLVAVPAGEQRRRPYARC